MRTAVLFLVGALVLSGCANSGGRESAADVQETVGTLWNATLSAYLHNVSQPIAGITVDGAILEHHRTAVDERVELDTWILRPDVREPVPLVLEVTPYYGGGDPTQFPIGGFGNLDNLLVPRGYAVGISSVRGTGNSGGCFTQGGPDEARDTAAVVEDMASKPWSNGAVGIMGVSYPGTTPQDVWVEAPPALKTIVPISGISDLYKYNFVNGVPINVQGFGFNSYYWAIVGLGPAGLSGGTQVLDPQHAATAAAGEACTDQAEVQEGGVSSTMDGDKDAYWQVRDFHAELQESRDMDAFRASVFYIHGLQDWNVKPHMMEDWITTIQETGVPFKAWLGQWGHAWPGPLSGCDEPGRSCRADWWEQVMVAWFDQFLKGIDTGILDAPAVQVQDDDGVWRHETDWPPADATWHRFGLHDGSLHQGMDGSGEVSYHDGNGAPHEAHGGLLTTLPNGEAIPGREVERVVWRTEPLAADWHLSGLPVFHANVTAEGARASLILTLAEELPNGDLRSINFAAQSLNHVQSLESGGQDISGMQQEVEVRFFPQDDVIHEGSRIVLIAAGNTVGGPGPGLQPISDGGMITIALEGAWLDLPVDHSVVVEGPQPYEQE